MKQGRTIETHTIVNNPQANTLKVELYYSKGGMNYFNGRNERRGLYLSVTPVGISKIEGTNFVTESFVGFSGIKKCVKETKRFSQKELDTFVVDAEDKQNLIDYVIKQGDLEIEKKDLVV